MNNYQLIPKDGWLKFSKNIEVTSYLYTLFMPLVNEGNWNYMNFTSDSGIFEDEVGNFVTLLYLEQDEETEIERLESLNVSIKVTDCKSIGFLESTMVGLAAKYGLKKLLTY